jgi:hypothetical protein
VYTAVSLELAYAGVALWRSRPRATQTSEAIQVFQARISTGAAKREGEEPVSKAEIR